MFSKIAENQVSKAIGLNRRAVPRPGSFHFSSEKDVHYFFLTLLICVFFNYTWFWPCNFEFHLTFFPFLPNN